MDSKLLSAILLMGAVLVLSCTPHEEAAVFHEDFDNVPDRIWIGKDFWAIPMEDWRVQDGRLECVGNRADMRVNLLTRVLGPERGDLSVSVRMGLTAEALSVASAGVRVGIHDEEDPDPRAACYFGRGTTVGVSTNGFLFVDQQTEELPPGFNLYDFRLSLSANPIRDAYQIVVTASDSNGNTASMSSDGPTDLKGLLALVNTTADQARSEEATRFWFDDWDVSGSKVLSQQEHRFGPILWSMYTLSRGVLKLTAQLPPLGPDEDQSVELQLKENEEWRTAAEAPVDADARTATFRIPDWDATRAVPFRLRYQERLKDGSRDPDLYEGMIQRDPVDRPLVFGGLTCQYGNGFPYSPLVRNLTVHDVDILYFSGDQIYESNGNYGIIRFPANRAILSYLGKWYMFGWAFRELMRDRPTICTPDDHDVFQGNIWGEGGQKIPLDDWNRPNGDRGGYVEPPRMVNVVHRTQCAHLPDPFDPTPIKQGISVFYTHLVYGRVSFAIVSDRMFKSHPSRVATWSGRPDHVMERVSDPSSLDRAELKFLGDRQIEFLERWIRDWRGIDMKAVLSQTVFVNIATHHGEQKMVAIADLDSGGWPRAARNRALSLMRKAFAFHISGDQHLPSLSQYGIDEFRDASWAFCTPAIYVGYERRFQPEQLGWKIEDPPAHGHPNTGYYRDGIGNPQYVYAIGNPVDEPRQQSRYQLGQDRSSGYGIVRFNQKERSLTVEAYRFLFDAENPTPEDQFPGWPHTISQRENYGRKAVGFLPNVHVDGLEDPVLLVENEVSGELEYALRIKGTEFSPMVFSRDRFAVKIGDPDSGDTWKTVTGVAPLESGTTRSLEVSF